MLYLDNAATSFPKAPGVAQEISRFLLESAGNPGRSGHRLALAAEQLIEDLRARLTRFFGGDDPRRMIFAFSTTDALNMALKGVLGLPVESPHRPHVVTTVLEHNSVSRPLEALVQAGRIELTRVECDEAGFVDPAAIERSLTPTTQMIVMTHASNVLGTIQDIAAVGQIARRHDVLFCVDAAQTAGVVPLSVREMHIDLLAFPGHKGLLGPTGTGGLWISAACAARKWRTWREGGTGGDSSHPVQPQEWPHLLEAGTPNTVGLAGLSASLEYVTQQPAGATLAHEQSLIQHLRERLAGDPRLTFYGCVDAKRCVGAASLNLAGYNPQDVAAILDSHFEIAVRAGLHCAPEVHRRLGTFPQGAVRVSPGVFNTSEDIDRLTGAIRQILG